MATADLLARTPPPTSTGTLYVSECQGTTAFFDQDGRELDSRRIHSEGVVVVLGKDVCMDTLWWAVATRNRHPDRASVRATYMKDIWRALGERCTPARAQGRFFFLACGGHASLFVPVRD